MIESFDIFINKSQDEHNVAFDWWTSLPEVLKSIGFFVNKIKPKLDEDDIKKLRLLYTVLNGSFKNSKQSNNVSEVPKEKQMLKDLLKALNELGDKTGFYCGVYKTRPKQSRGPYVKTEGRWVTIYKFTYGSDKAYISDTF